MMRQYSPDIHHCRSVRLREYDYSCGGLYFVTVCVQNQEGLFGSISDGSIYLNQYGMTVEREWLGLCVKYPHVELYEFVVMSDHFHGIIKIGNANVSVATDEPRPDHSVVRPAESY